MSKPIRIPRTTAMFVTSLGKIIRDHFGLDVVMHECWTFSQVADYEICGNPGNCLVHDAPWVDHADPSCIAPCYEFTNKIYLGVGDVRLRGGIKCQLRTRIEHTHWDIGGELYVAQVWASSSPSEIIRGQFGLCEDGRPYEQDEKCPTRPPSKIDFWRSASAA